MGTLQGGINLKYMKIVFFGTANVALPILEVLKKQHEIAAVVTKPDAEAAGRRICRKVRFRLWLKI